MHIIIMVRSSYVKPDYSVQTGVSNRYRGATLRLGRGGGGSPLVIRYWGGHRHLFLPILYNYSGPEGAHVKVSPPF